MQNEWRPIRNFVRGGALALFAIGVCAANAWPAGDPTPAVSGQSPSYVMKKGGAFVYEKIPGVDSTKPEYVLVWYLGKRASGPLIRYQDGDMTAILECYEDCQYVRWTGVPEGRSSVSGRIRVINDPVLYSILRDATSGLLD